MPKRYGRPLFWILFLFMTFGFLCNFIALVLPQWFARYPYAKSPFVCLGLWEICFEKYMVNEISNVVFDGCFYIFESPLYPLWTILFRAWFICCQVFHTFSFITYVFAEGIMVTQAVRLVSIRGSRAVLLLLIVSTATCIFILVTLITMGVGVNTEKRLQPMDSNNQWLNNLDETTLSWSYGFAGLSIFPVFLALILLGWFVYPKKSSNGLLLPSAWEWPTYNDLACTYHVNDLVIHRLNSISIPHQLHDIPLSPTNRSSCKRRMLHNVVNESATSQNERCNLMSDNDILSSYDPRSADTLSLHSIEPQSIRNVSQYTSMRTNASLSINNNSQRPNSRKRMTSNRSLSSAVNSYELEHRGKLAPDNNVSNTDSSVWTAHESVQPIGNFMKNVESIQIARPMKPLTKNKRKAKYSSTSYTLSTPRTEVPSSFEALNASRCDIYANVPMTSNQYDSKQMPIQQPAYNSVQVARPMKKH